MIGKLLRARLILGLPVMLAILVVAAACAAAETPTPIVIEKEVIREVEVIVEKEVIREIEVPVVVEKVVVEIVEVTPTPRGPQPAFTSYLYRGAAPRSFNEAPELAELVKQGKLPPVEQRLPDEPLVLEGPDGIGRYGGTLRFGFTFGGGAPGFINFNDGLMVSSWDGNELEPNVAKSWEITNAYRTFKFNLRKGMKWSDGEPFTAEDYKFAFEALISNAEMNPKAPDPYHSGGELAKLEKLDDHTISYTFPDSSYVFPETLVYWKGGGAFWGIRIGNRNAYVPAHYMKQFHPDYTTKVELDKRITDKGFDNWILLWRDRISWWANPDLPAIGLWKSINTWADPLWRIESNPYLWQVDPEGNQLPYIGKWVGQQVTDREILNLHAIAGDFDAQDWGIDAKKLTLFFVNSEKGDYRAVLWPSPNVWSVSFNLTHGAPGATGDPALGKWFRNLDFRRAVALGIDKEEMLSSLFSGIGEVRATIPVPDTNYYPGPEYEKKFTEYDPKEAERILDRIGLDKKDSEGFRIDPETGNRLIIWLHPGGARGGEDVAELVALQLANVGLMMNVRLSPDYYPRHDYNLLQMVIGQLRSDPWGGGGYTNNFHATSVDQWTWVTEEGKRIDLFSLTPDQEFLSPIAHIEQLFEQGKTLPLEERGAVGQELVRTFVDNLYHAPLVGGIIAGDSLKIVSNKLRNFPQSRSGGRSSMNKALYFFE